jgi:hypothetical protein
MSEALCPGSSCCPSVARLRLLCFSSPSCFRVPGGHFPTPALWRSSGASWEHETERGKRSPLSRFRSVMPGAVLAVVLWAITSVGFSFYLASFANYGVTYGSLVAAVGLLFYLYASVVLFGAELNAAIHRPAANSDAEEPNKREADLRRTHP